MVASLLRDRKSVRLSEETVRWSLYGRIYGFWSLGTPFVCPCFGRLKIWSMLIYSVRVTYFGPDLDIELVSTPFACPCP